LHPHPHSHPQQKHRNGEIPSPNLTDLSNNFSLTLTSINDLFIATLTLVNLLGKFGNCSTSAWVFFLQRQLLHNLPARVRFRFCSFDFVVGRCKLYQYIDILFKYIFRETDRPGYFFWQHFAAVGGWSHQLISNFPSPFHSTEMLRYNIVEHSFNRPALTLKKGILILKCVVYK